MTSDCERGKPIGCGCPRCFTYGKPMAQETGAGRAMGQPRPPHPSRPSRRRAPADWQKPLSTVYDSTAASPIDLGGIEL
jgi:hypothetical protein